MIRCLAIDDERYAAEIIANFIQKTPSLTLVATITNVLEAIPLIQEDKVDLIFLDIQMPELTGIQFLKIIGTKCKVILTTAYPDYALEGYELDIVDYLMKPIAFDRFLKAVHKAQIYFQPKEKAQELLPPENVTDYMFIKGDSKNKFLKIAYADILYIEGLKNYVSIYTRTTRIISYLRLSDLQESLPNPPFARIHKSYIISIHAIDRIEGHSVFIKDRYLNISESYRDSFYQLIKLSNTADD